MRGAAVRGAAAARPPPRTCSRGLWARPGDLPGCSARCHHPHGRGLGLAAPPIPPFLDPGSPSGPETCGVPGLSAAIAVAPQSGRSIVSSGAPALGVAGCGPERRRGRRGRNLPPIAAANGADRLGRVLGDRGGLVKVRRKGFWGTRCKGGERLSHAPAGGYTRGRIQRLRHAGRGWGCEGGFLPASLS